MSKDKIDVAKKVEKEHVHLNKAFGEIKLTIMQEVTAEEFQNWRLEFLWQVRDFKNSLLKHFDLEEEGGFMRDVLKAAPHTGNKIEELKKEHVEIIEALDKIIDQIKLTPEKDGDKLNAIRMGINEMMSTLCNHENQENDLMQRAYYREFGGPA